jgi:dihydroxyacetone kinase-like predicted kinase
MQRYINGEALDDKSSVSASEVIDYSSFSSESKFEFGYCTEFLLQLTSGAEPFDSEAFRGKMESLGDSIVYSLEGDKIKLHIHSRTPEVILAEAHRYGEFLSLKIENMSVQHTALKSAEGKVVDSHKRPDGAYAVVAVSHSESLTRLFEDMGADVVISLGKSDTPCVQDFIDAYRAAGNEKILVFPNNINYVLTANQARELYGEGEVVVLKSRTVADCYSALALSDFLCEDFGQVVSDACDVIENIHTVRITTAARDAVYGDVELEEGDVIAISGASLLGVGDDACTVACDTIARVMDEDERDCITVFHSSDTSGETVNTIKDFISANYVYTEVNFVSADDSGEELLISFE